MTAKDHEIVLRIYLEHTGNVWQAICVDLDIAAQGETRTEAENLINSMIASYIEHVATLPADERRYFLNRKAPLGLRLHLACKVFIANLLANRNSNDRVSVISHYHCHA